MRISDWSSDVCSSDLFPAQLADVADADRQHRRRAEGDPARAGEGKGGVGDVLFGDRFQHRARLGAAEIDERVSGSDLYQEGGSVFWQVAVDPVRVVHAEAAAGHDVETVGRKRSEEHTSELQSQMGT